MKKSVRTKRTVTELLAVKNKSLIGRIRYRNLPRHTFIYCRSRNISARFLADAEAEGFTFGDGKKPAEKEYDDIFSLHDDLTISYTGWAGHVLFRNAVGNLIRIDYGKYIAGASDYQMPCARGRKNRSPRPC